MSANRIQKVDILRYDPEKDADRIYKPSKCHSMRPCLYSTQLVTSKIT